ncbi:succinate--CoA ligase subunit alpha [Chachezhania antarctica]|uniref:succinate--CoA ligase subunit alpha n=1 Tax=Chachezhania antarctica TaxID=2340860 RepID=UPI000EADF445|nr:succinate--CoA ligase subunit alpha [Chachezhania antarctica]|tara:strand:+ start:109 stop:987 length:879 start_codon:yes stop_codon:yes gene_type:complete
MSIFVNADTRVIVQGMTGRAGTFYTDQAMRYGATYVGGVRPGKGGRRHLDLPLFNSVSEAVEGTGANASLVIVPAPFAANAMIEAIEAGIGVVVCVTERVPQHDMARVKAALRQSDTMLIGPNSQGILTPGQCKIGVMPTVDAKPGNIGIASRSASLTSEILAQCSKAGLGQSTTVGIGGDTLHGVDFVDCLKRFKDDPETEAVVLVGEIGGREEEEAAAYLKSVNFGKPVVALVVGRHAPEGRRMGHAGTLSTFGLASAAEKIDVLRDAGVAIANTADDVVAAIGTVPVPA